MDNLYIKIAIPLLVGYLLDLILGDPRWLPHPVRVFGNLIIKGDKFLNRGKAKFIKGAALTLFLCITVYLFFYYITEALFFVSPIAYAVFAAIFIFFGLANKSLIKEGKEVFDALHYKGLEAGRKRLSWIVGRDTSRLDPNQIRTAVLETMSENLSDGVVAPLFYFAIGGLPGMMCYKMINTLDSMIGYKNEKYILFGKFAARLDDVANYIPARITALLMGVISLNKRSFVFIVRYGSSHSSPNAGYPEAALAGILNCRFGGPNIYHGKVVEKPFLGCNQREIEHHDFRKAAYINQGVTLVSIIFILILYRLLF